MGSSYEAAIGTLGEELARIEQVFGGLTPDEWRAETHLVPLDPSLPRWTVFELAVHFDISIGAPGCRNARGHRARRRDETHAASLSALWSALGGIRRAHRSRHRGRHRMVFYSASGRRVAVANRPAS
jgi:hypothetical protein